MKMAVGTVAEDGAILVLGDFSQDSRLIEGLDDHGQLSESSIEDCIRLVESYRRMLKGMGGVEEVRAVATSALRRAVNSEALCRRIEQRTGVIVSILPSDEEAAYVYASSHDLAIPHAGGKVLIAYVGAASTKFAVGSPDGLIDVHSVPLGAALVAKRFFAAEPVSPEQFIKACEFLDEKLDLSKVSDLLDGSAFSLVACGSTASGLCVLEEGLLEPNRNLTHAKQIPFDALFEWFEHLVHVPPEEMNEVPMLAGFRGRVFLGGLSLWLFIMEKLGIASLIVSENGVRHGLLREVLGLERKLE